MSFRKKETSNFLLYDTEVENLFISEYAKAAPGDYVKVYLLGLMYANLAKPLDNSDIAKAFGLSFKEVDAAWQYWKSAGIVDLLVKNPDNPDRYDVEFLSIKENLLGGSSARKTNRVSDSLSSRTAAELFHGIENTCGRLLDAREPEAVTSWVKDFGIDPSVILYAYDYCTNKKDASNRFPYVEKVVKAWNERGLATVDMVKDFLGEKDRHYAFYKGVFNALGFRRNPTQPEQELMDVWMDDMGLNLSDVEKACKKTVGINNPNLKYINTILVSQKQEEEDKNSEKIISVEDLYEKIREENSKKAEAKRAEVYSKVPALGDVMERLRASSFNATSCMLSGNKEGFLKEKENQKKLIREKTDLLREAGFKEDALDPVYTCRECSDTGILEDGRRCRCYSLRLAELKNE